MIISSFIRLCISPKHQWKQDTEKALPPIYTHPLLHMTLYEPTYLLPHNINWPSYLLLHMIQNGSTYTTPTGDKRTQLADLATLTHNIKLSTLPTPTDDGQSQLAHLLNHKRTHPPYPYTLQAHYTPILYNST